ncbi:serine-rich adhesin for platelets isoform X2 [Parasteatoda tepidariorum]|uniref:serine-rich adhesin for platelets isoform X2 n=1 Tax=Parasteatoda tepidariorum TaxID=114398 RepID=UPI0039BD3796
MHQSKKLKESDTTSSVTTSKISSKSNNHKQIKKHRTCSPKKLCINSIADSIPFLLQSSKVTVDSLSIQNVLSNCTSSCKHCVPFNCAVPLQDVVSAYGYIKKKMCVNSNEVIEDPSDISSENQFQNETVMVETHFNSFSGPLLSKKSFKNENINSVHLKSTLNDSKAVLISSGYVSKSESEENEKSLPEDDTANFAHSSKMSLEIVKKTEMNTKIKSVFVENAADLTSTIVSSLNLCPDSGILLDTQDTKFVDNQQKFKIFPKAKMSFSKTVSNQILVQKTNDIDIIKFKENINNSTHSVSEISCTKNLYKEKESLPQGIGQINISSQHLTEQLKSVPKIKDNSNNKLVNESNDSSLIQTLISRKSVKRKKSSKINVAAKNVNTSEFTKTSNLTTNSCIDELFDESVPSDFLVQAKFLKITVNDAKQTFGLSPVNKLSIENKATNSSLNDVNENQTVATVSESSAKSKLVTKKSLKLKRINSHYANNQINGQTSSVLEEVSDKITIKDTKSTLRLSDENEVSNGVGNTPLDIVSDKKTSSQNVDKCIVKSMVAPKKSLKLKKIGNAQVNVKSTSDFNNASNLDINPCSDDLLNERVPPDFLKEAKLFKVTVSDTKRKFSRGDGLYDEDKVSNASLNDVDKEISIQTVDVGSKSGNSKPVTKRPLKLKGVDNNSVNNKTSTRTSNVNPFSDDDLTESAPLDFLMQAKLMKVTVEDSKRTLRESSNIEKNELTIVSCNKNSNKDETQNATNKKSFRKIGNSWCRILTKRSLRNKNTFTNCHTSVPNTENYSKVIEVNDTVSKHIGNEPLIHPSSKISLKSKLVKNNIINKNFSLTNLTRVISSSTNMAPDDEVVEPLHCEENFVHSASNLIASSRFAHDTIIDKNESTNIELNKINFNKNLNQVPLSKKTFKRKLIRNKNNSDLTSTNLALTISPSKILDLGNEAIIPIQSNEDNAIISAQSSGASLEFSHETDINDKNESTSTKLNAVNFNKNSMQVSQLKKPPKRKVINNMKNTSSNSVNVDSGIVTDKVMTNDKVSAEQFDDEENILSNILNDPVELELPEDILLNEDLEIPSFSEKSLSYESDVLKPSTNFRTTMVNSYSKQYSDSEDSDLESSFKRRKSSSSTQLASISTENIFDDKNREFNDESSHDYSSISSLSSFTRKHSCSTPSTHSDLKESCSLFNSTEFVEHFQDPDYLSEDENFQKSFQEIIEGIKSACNKNDIQKAIALADKYIPISTPDVKADIFRTLFINIIKCFKSSNLNPKSERNDTALGDINKILVENNLYQSDVCSMIIYESFASELCISFTTKVFLHCMENQITLSEESILKYAEFLKHKGDATNILTFLIPVGNINYFRIPDILFQELLEACAYDKSISPKDFTKLCEIISDINSVTLEDAFLKGFFRNCIENEQWFQINRMFCSCAENGRHGILKNLYFALAFPLNEAGDCYEKFIASVFNSPSDLPAQVMVLVAHFGISLLLETYTNNELDSSLPILYLLHKYDINYWEVHLPLTFSDTNGVIKLYPHSVEGYVLRETVIHAAIDIFLHFKRPQDAFSVFQVFFNDELSDIKTLESRGDIFMERYLLLMKITGILRTTNQLGEGLKALYMLLSMEEKEFRTLYSMYLTDLLNEERIDEALDLFEKKCGPIKENLNLNIYACVRRGLLLSYAEKGLIDKAKKQFRIGYIKNNYPKLDENPKQPFCYWIKTFWTKYEIKFALEMFFEELHPILLTKNTPGSRGCFKIWLQLRNNALENNSVTCLVKVPSDVESAYLRTREALQSIDSDLEKSGIERKKKREKLKCLELPSEAFYQFWKKKFCPPLGKSVNKGFVVNCKQRISFGITEPEKRAQDFERITLFLLRRVQLKYRDLTPDAQHQKASELAVSFIRINQVMDKLDRRTMKLLHDFAEKCL